jgi:hypothetical protein
MKRLLDRGVRKHLAQDFEEDWVAQDYPSGAWRGDGYLAFTSRVVTGVGERMRFVIHHEEFKAFVFYTQ